MTKGALVFLASLALLVGLARLPGPAASGSEDGGQRAPTTVGARSCKLCHFKQYKSWAQTPMARAFESLRPGKAVQKKRAGGLDPDRDYTSDPSCLECHTTAYGTEHGYPAVSARAPTQAERDRMSRNEGVTCEACHGPGSLYRELKRNNKTYKRSEIVALGAVAPVTAEQCVACHARGGCPTMGDDYHFDFESRVQRVHDHRPLKYPH